MSEPACRNVTCPRGNVLQGEAQNNPRSSARGNYWRGQRWGNQTSLPGRYERVGQETYDGTHPKGCEGWVAKRLGVGLTLRERQCEGRTRKRREEGDTRNGRASDQMNAGPLTRSSCIGTGLRRKKGKKAHD